MELTDATHRAHSVNGCGPSQRCANRLSLCLLVATLVGVSLSAQRASYVAVITENLAPGNEGTSVVQPGGSFAADHVSARGLIKAAHEVQPFQIVDAPAWLGDVFYDVRAHTSSPTAGPAETLAMVRTLLEDRFQLASHREKRLMDGFALVQIDPDLSRMAIRPSSVKCGSAPQPAACSANALSAGFLRSVGRPLDPVADMLEGLAGAPIVNDTDMPGLVDLELRWPRDLPAGGDVSALSTSLEKQLGLSLRAIPVPVEVLVIDRVERARPDQP